MTSLRKQGCPGVPRGQKQECSVRIIQFRSVLRVSHAFSDLLLVLVRPPGLPRAAAHRENGLQAHLLGWHARGGAA